MTKRNKIIFRSIVITSIVIFIVIVIIRKREFVSHLKANYTIVTGKITLIEVQHKSANCYANYDFYFKNKLYHGYRGIDGITYSDALNYFNNKCFPVLVDTLKPEYNAIMVTPDHFDKMNWAYPDSLQWVKKYYTKDFYESW